MRSYIRNIWMWIIMVIMLTSCELFGLDYQFDYENESTPVVTELNVDCYEYIQSRSNLDLVLMFEAINRAEMREFYEADNRTFFLLDDTEFARWLSYGRYASINSVPKFVLQDFLRSYTIPGMYAASDLSTAPVDVLTFNGIKKIRLYLYKTAPTSSQNLNSMFAGYVPTGDIAFRGSSFYTTNLRPTNGVAHLLQKMLQ